MRRRFLNVVAWAAWDSRLRRHAAVYPGVARYRPGCRNRYGVLPDMMTIDLNRMLKPGTRGVLSMRLPDGTFKVIGSIKAKRRLSKGYRKHLRQLKARRK